MEKEIYFFIRMIFKFILRIDIIEECQSISEILNM